MSRSGGADSLGADAAAREMRAERLTRVLDEVQRLCAELDEMSRRQGAELDAGRAEAATGVVEERGRLVSRLGEAAAELGSDAVGFERLLSGVPEALAARARDQAARIAGVVRDVLARDEEDRRLMESERDRLAGELAGIGRGRAAVGAYGGGHGGVGVSDPMMQDRRG